MKSRPNIPIVPLREAAAIANMTPEAFRSAARHHGFRSGYPVAAAEWIRDSRPGRGARTDLTKEPAMTTITLVSAAPGDLIDGVELGDPDCPNIPGLMDHPEVAEFLRANGYGPGNPDELMYLLQGDASIPEGLESVTITLPPVYTVQVEASGGDGIWQAIAPAEVIAVEAGETAQDVAEWTASNQTEADGDAMARHGLGRYRHLGNPGSSPPAGRDCRLTPDVRQRPRPA